MVVPDSAAKTPPAATVSRPPSAIDCRSIRPPDPTLMGVAKPVRFRFSRIAAPWEIENPWLCPLLAIVWPDAPPSIVTTPMEGGESVRAACDNVSGTLCGMPDREIRVSVPSAARLAAKAATVAGDCDICS